MIDSIYKAVQALLNKDQLGYLKPLDFNSFIDNAQNKVWNKLLTDLKSSIRKSNWMLDGKNYANYSEHVKQLLEYFGDEEPITVTSGSATLPSTLEFVEDVYFGDTVVDKIDYADFKLIKRNKLVSPTECTPVCSKLGDTLKIAPDTIDSIDLHYLRKPKTPKWTFEPSANNKPMYDPTKSDFQDVDMPYSVKDELISHVFLMASVQLREYQSAQLENQEQNQEAQLENRQ